MGYHKSISLRLNWAESNGTSAFYVKLNPYDKPGFMVGWNVWKPRYLSVFAE